MSARPPRWAEALLERCVGSGLGREGLLGDLHEEFEQRAASSPSSAALWYAAETLDIAVRFTLRRIREGGRRPGGTSMGGWARDLRYAGRRIAREPGFTSVVVVTVGIAVAANASIFGAVRPVISPKLPFPEPDRIVRIWEQNVERGWTRSSASWHDARDWASATRTLEALAVYTVWEGNLVTDETAQRVRYTLAEPDFFRVLGVAPLAGRALLPEEIEPDRDGVVVLSHGLWTRAFGSDPDIVGRSVRLGGETLEVVGVMPATFAYPAEDISAWKPFGMDPDQAGGRDSYWVSVIGRLAPGVSVQEAQDEMTGIGIGLEEAYPETNAGFRPLLEPVAEVAVLNVRTGVLVLWGAVGVLLLVACANVATLLLARSEARSSEMSMRIALGAGRLALVRQLFTENLLTAALGGGLGLLLAIPATAGISRLFAPRLSYGLDVGLDPVVFTYTALVTAATGVAFGLLPAVRGSSGQEGGGASARGTGRQASGRLRSLLVAGQTGLAVVILVAAGLLGRTLTNLASVDPGYPLDGALSFRVAPPQVGMDRPEAAALLETIRSTIDDLPGVTAAASVNNLPLAGSRWGSQWSERGRLGEPGLRAFARVVQPGFLRALGVPLLQGRTFEPTDDARSEPVAIVSATAVQRYWPDGDPIGAYISLAPDDARAPWVRVVGVVGDIEATTLGAGPAAVVYTPFEQSVFGHFGDWGMDFVVRTAGDARVVAESIREAVREIDPTLPVYSVATLEDSFRSQLDATRALGGLMAVFALVALFLSALGVYGTLAYGVSRQVPQIGVRMALGADVGSVVSGVLRSGLSPAAAGLAGGLLLATAAGKWVEQLLFGVRPIDPATYGVIAATMLVVALAASAIPAWRAARVNPAEALRRE